MKILIFGGEGFVGKSLKMLLERNNIEYLSVSRSSEKTVDISNFEDFFKIKENYFDIVVNCATILPNGYYLDSVYLNKILKTNIIGAQNICKWVQKQLRIKRIINCSTLVVANKPWPVDMNERYSNPPIGNHVLYSSSKLFQESIFETFGVLNDIEVINLRFSAIYGMEMPWSGILCSLIDKAVKNEKISLSNGDFVSFDFINVCDVSDIILKFIFDGEKGIYNIASGEEIYLLELANLIIELSNSKSIIENSNQDNAVLNRSKIDISKLKKQFPTKELLSIEQGIRQLIK